MRYGSVCSGIEAATVAWHPLGWKPEFFAQYDPEHSYKHGPDFASAVLAHHYPQVPNLGDMTKFEGWPDADIDVLVGGTPCFPAHVLIATRRGLVPISQVRVGDEVLSHALRWCKVVRTGSKVAPTVVLRGQGLTDGLHTTANHPIYAREKARVWVGRKNGSWESRLSSASWVCAGAMKDKFWCSPAIWPHSSVPPVESKGNERPVSANAIGMMRLVGRWLGDGWLRFQGERRAYAMICAGKHEADDLADVIRLAGLHATRSEESTTVRFQIASKAFARWLREHFGQGAHHKTMPTWLFGLGVDLRRAFFDGYVGADGCGTGHGWRLTTVSRALALGMTLLAHSLGFSATRTFVRPKRQCVIGGRMVNEAGFYQVTIYRESRSSEEAEGLRWGKVRKVEDAEAQTVYDLEVEGDHSYVADGICVHNCQDFSVAGLRAGLDGERGNLMLVYAAIARSYRPKWLVWENVPGVLSSHVGRDFGSLLGLLSGQRIEVPPGGWQTAGVVPGIERAYGLAWRVLDAQFVRVDGFGRAVPQRRRRVFVVGYFGDWRRSGAVLFERSSLSGNPPPRRQAGQGTAGTLAARANGGGGLGTDFECDGGLVPSHYPTRARGGWPDGGDGRHDQLVADLAVSAVAQPLNDLDGASHSLAAKATASGYMDAHVETYIGEPLVFDETQITSKTNRSHPRAGDPSHPLAAGARPPTIAFTAKDYGGDAMEEVSPTLRAGGFTNSHANGGVMPAVTTSWRVRRLMPVECERLQGFPDGYTNIPWRGRNSTPDGPRYKALGNSMAVNVMRWLGRRIEMVEQDS